FQAEDGIRDGHVTGVQTCALPICHRSRLPAPASRQSQALDHRAVEVLLTLQQALDPSQEHPRLSALDDAVVIGARERHDLGRAEIGRASCRERVEIWGVAVSWREA